MEKVAISVFLLHVPCSLCSHYIVSCVMCSACCYRAMGAAAVGAVVGFMVVGPLTAVVAGGAALYGEHRAQ